MPRKTKLLPSLCQEVDLQFGARKLLKLFSYPPTETGRQGDENSNFSFLFVLTQICPGYKVQGTYTQKQRGEDWGCFALFLSFGHSKEFTGIGFYRNNNYKGLG